MAVLPWLGKKLIGDAGYNPDRSKIETARGDEERALGLESRGEQQQLGQFYQQGIEGKGPSVAQQQMAQGARTAMAAAAAGRGTNQALAQRNAADIAQQTNNASAQLRAQEQMGYAKQYSDLVQAQRMQDLLARGYSVDEAKAQLNYDAQLQKTKADIASGEAERGQKAVGGVLTAAGAALGISDENAKEAIEPVGMGFRPAPARASMIPTAPVRTVGGGMQVPEMAAPEQVESAGPSFGQRVGNALMGVGGGASGNYQPLIDAMKAQQREAERQNNESMAGQEEKSASSAAGAGLMGLGMSLSDKDSKAEIRDLTTQNSALVSALKHLSFPKGRPGASQLDTAPMTPEQRAEGEAAFGRMESGRKLLADKIFQTTIPPATMTQNRPEMHREAAADYARRIEAYEKGYQDKMRDLRALEAAAAIERGRMATPAQIRFDYNREAEAADAARQALSSPYPALVGGLKKKVASR